MKKNLLDTLSVLGRRLQFPHNCILNQAEEQKNISINASAGTTTIDNKYCFLPSFTQYFDDDPSEIVKYTPLLGLPELRQAYKDRILMQNNLLPNLIGLPIITNGITHALNLARELFLDPNDELLIHDMYWENNDLIFKVLGQVNIKKYSMFSANKFNIIGFREMLYSRSNISRPNFIFFNFPNNPTGYTPDYEEMHSTSCYGAEKWL